MKKIVLILCLFWISIFVSAQKSFDPDNLLSPRTGVQKLVNDYTSTLTQAQIEALENKLVLFDDSTSTQIAVVIVPTIGGNDIADYSVKLGRAWGIGNKDFNNGIILLIAKEDRKLNIATGYGVEGALPDITCKHIIDEVIVPNFKGEDYYQGIDEGTDAIIKATKGEYAAPENYHQRGGKLSIGKIILIIIFVTIFLIIMSSRGGGGTMVSRRGIGPVFWGLGGGSSGSSDWGGSGGGGFGGFGGGSFGGGGASGSW